MALYKSLTVVNTAVNFVDTNRIATALVTGASEELISNYAKVGFSSNRFLLSGGSYLLSEIIAPKLIDVESCQDELTYDLVVEPLVSGIIFSFGANYAASDNRGFLYNIFKQAGSQIIAKYAIARYSKCKST